MLIIRDNNPNTASNRIHKVKKIISLAACCCALLASANAMAETRNVMVHLFEWKWNDIKKECAYLEEKGYGSVQVSPPNEHAIKDNYPWWQRYQPVSYELNKSRSGTLAEFKSMVESCWKDHQVKIYVDAVINHMAGGDGIGSNGHVYQGGNSYYLYSKNGQEVRYDRNDFHKQCDIDWSKNPVPADEIQKCWIGGGLPDLKTEDSAEDKAKTRIVDFLNSMIDIGVAGFRIDAAKHMHPGDIVNINNRLHNLRSDQNWFAANERPFIYQEVINGDRQEVTPEQYTSEARGKKQNILEFRYGQIIGKKFRKDSGESIADFLTYNFPVANKGWGMVDSSYAVVFTDNHDNQRGHGNGFFTSENKDSIGGVVTHYYDSAIYSLANVFMLAWPYGTPQVMSSYNWNRNVKKVNNEFKDSNDWMGPPSDGNGNTRDVSCNNGWICEHRWGAIAGMVGFNNYTQDAWNIGYKWIGGAKKIAFARVKPNGVSSGFVVINADSTNINTRLNTGLPAGFYCDVAQQAYNFTKKTCSGSPIEVDNSGYAQFNVNAMQASALHAGALVCTTETCSNPQDRWESAYLVSSANHWLSAPMTRLTDDEWKIDETFSDANPRFKVCRYKDWSSCEPSQDKPISEGSGKYTITFNSHSKNFSVEKDTALVNVNFTCNLGYTYWGTSVYIVGNYPELGGWTLLSNKQKMFPSRYPTWTLSLQLPKNIRYEWKCVKARESDLIISQWAPGANIVFSTETSDTATTGAF